ncbi:DUF885 family protein [Sorangium sp. So ce281]|uniref:DUF885 family protein n=1 Tax=unclassified Sorangium TaxID=2621164 RepID=UPI003F5F4DF0
MLPLSLPGPSDELRRIDDFTYAAASWTLTAHAARPGHELQLASLVERGVSIARAVFAENSANMEGWALCSEAILLPFMPPEVERYTCRAPGQATSYFDGFTRLMELRREIASTMGSRFDAQRFHDFVLAQGILPLKLLRKAVIERFVPAQPSP